MQTAANECSEMDNRKVMIPYWSCIKRKRIGWWIMILNGSYKPYIICKELYERIYWCRNSAGIQRIDYDRIKSWSIQYVKGCMLIYHWYKIYHWYASGLKLLWSIELKSIRFIHKFRSWSENAEIKVKNFIYVRV